MYSTLDQDTITGTKFSPEILGISAKCIVLRSSAAQEMQKYLAAQNGWGISHGKELVSAKSKLSIKERGSGCNRQHFRGRMKAGKSFLLDNCFINQSDRTKGLKTEIFLTPLHCYSR